jgi:hypothetical protein
MPAGKRWFSAAAMLACGALAAPASALESGVYPDPGSPAGKEYAIITAQVRGSGTGRPAAPGVLFGAGIARVGAKPGVARRSGTAKRASRVAGGAPVAVPAAAAPGPGSSNGFAWPLIAAVLIPTALAAIYARLSGRVPREG